MMQKQKKNQECSGLSEESTCTSFTGGRYHPYDKGGVNMYELTNAGKGPYRPT